MNQVNDSKSSSDATNKLDPVAEHLDYALAFDAGWIAAVEYLSAPGVPPSASDCWTRALDVRLARIRSDAALRRLDAAEATGNVYAYEFARCELGLVPIDLRGPEASWRDFELGVTP